MNSWTAYSRLKVIFMPMCCVAARKTDGKEITTDSRSGTTC
jgi:hypothetical protein